MLEAFTSLTKDSKASSWASWVLRSGAEARLLSTRPGAPSRSGGSATLIGDRDRCCLDRGAGHFATGATKDEEDAETPFEALPAARAEAYWTAGNPDIKAKGEKRTMGPNDKQSQIAADVIDIYLAFVGSAGAHSCASKMGEGWQYTVAFSSSVLLAPLLLSSACPSAR